MSKLFALYLGLGLLFVDVAAMAAAQSAAFTYQGELRNGDVPVIGLPDLEFRLFDAAVGGNQVGASVVAPDYPVLDGLLSIELDFGSAPFSGQQRWLEINVDGLNLLPRQKLTATPYATVALSVQPASVDSASVIDGSITAVDVDPAAIQRRVVQGCVAGSAIRGIDATGNVSCETIGGGDITAVVAGTGLSGGGSVGDVTIAVGSNAITAAQLADAAVGVAEIDTSQVQSRVASTCAAGSSIRQINADGTVICDALPAGSMTPRPPFSRANIDLPGQVRDVAITLGTDGLALISYFDTVGKDLRVAHCSDVACNAVTDSLIDGAGDVGEFSAITITGNGLGAISYYDRSNGDLKFASCSNMLCTAATLFTLDSGTATGEDVGPASSIVLNSAGAPVVSYYDVSRGDLKLALCAATAPYCGSRTLWTLDGAASDAGARSTALLVPEGGTMKIYVGYYDRTAGDLRLARCFDTNCSAPALSTIDANNDAGILLAGTLGSDGLPLLVYATQNGAAAELRAAHCDVIGCSATTRTLLSSPSAAITDVALIIAGDNAPMLAANIAGQGAFPMRCSNAACTAAYAVTTNALNLIGSDASPFGITLGADGFPLFATRRVGASGNLNILHCADHLCVPYRR